MRNCWPSSCCSLRRSPPGAWADREGRLQARPGTGELGLPPRAWGAQGGEVQPDRQGTDQAGNVRYGGRTTSSWTQVRPSGSRISTRPPARGQPASWRCGDLRRRRRRAERAGKAGRGGAGPGQGTEFWSLPLDIASLSDGEHTLTATGVDVNGTEGPPTAVRFQVDKTAPVIRVSSHAAGALVTGQVELKGEVEDPNGIASLAWSRDGGASFQPLRMALDKPGSRAAFQEGLDTRGLADGPLVLWFQARDRTGSVSRQAFLLFVNNEAPVLEILSPPGCGRQRAPAGGRPRFGQGRPALPELPAGGRRQGAVPLTPGDLYWAQELDLTGRKPGPAQASFTWRTGRGPPDGQAAGAGGPEPDRPLLTLASPQRGARLAGPFSCRGSCATTTRWKAWSTRWTGAPRSGWPPRRPSTLSWKTPPPGSTSSRSRPWTPEASPGCR